MSPARLKRFARRTGRAVVYTIALLLILIGAAIGSLETGWGKNRLRQLVVSQANKYLTATLEIGQLGGSLFRGLELSNISLSRDGKRIVAIDRVSLSYNIRELVTGGTIVRSIRLERPQFDLAKQPDGRWNISALVRREARDQNRTGPGRSIHLQHIEVIDGLVVLHDPLAFGAARVPGRYEHLNVTTTFDYVPVSWQLNFANASWTGGPDDLTVEQLSGGVGSGHDGWQFQALSVRTPHTAFTLNGRVIRGERPTELDLRVKADRFSFQEWRVVLPALKNIPIEAAFDTKLTGPLAAMLTELDLKSNGGAARGQLLINTSVPGWHGKGALDVTGLDIAPWFNRPDRPSNITGRVGFDMALRLGRGIPEGSYTFDGRHAGYFGYEGDNLHLRGNVTPKEWRIRIGTGVAYGSAMTLRNSTIALASPYRFHFEGTASGVDLRKVPITVPVPHVESLLAFDFVTDGQFVRPYLLGNATFDRSEFIGAEIAPGTVGSVDTAAMPLHYTGEGTISGVNLGRFGDALEIAWMQDPRWAGTITGRFKVDVQGADAASLAVIASGQLERAEMFRGTLSDAAVDVQIDQGSLRGTYDGRFSQIDPAIAFGDPRFSAQLTGAGRVSFDINDLMLRTPVLDDYLVEGTATFEHSMIRDIPIDNGSVQAHLGGGNLLIDSATAVSEQFDLKAMGRLALDDEQQSAIDYDIRRADLAFLAKSFGTEASGILAAKGVVTGPTTALHLVGPATITDLDYAGVSALSTSGLLDVTFPLSDPAQLAAKVTLQASFASGFGVSLQQVDGTATYDKRHVTLDTKLALEGGREGTLAGAFLLHEDNHAIDVERMDVSVGQSAWRLTSTSPPTVRWTDEEIAVTQAAFVDADNGDQQLQLDGTWRFDGAGALNLKARHLFLDTFTAQNGAPARYGGVIEADAVLKGTRERPIVTGTVLVTDGRVDRLSYEKLQGKIDYADNAFVVDLRLDQAPGIWLTANGSVPLALFDKELPEQPMDFQLTSSDVSLGLLDGLTALVTGTTGTLRANVRVLGTSLDPHFDGYVSVVEAGFQVTATGARYKNGSASIQLAADRLTVESLHLEDRNGRPLDMKGSLATQELRVGDVAIDIKASRFEVLRNALGTLDINAQLAVRGDYDAPRVSGTVTILDGELRVDEILTRAMFQPYATRPLAAPAVDAIAAIAALNPWDRLAVDIKLQSPGTLRLVGDNVTVNDQAPLGLGSFNLRATGDLFIFKAPGQTATVTGSLDSITGSYAFQGKRFELYPSSSVDFRGGIDPEIFVSVSRVISGVETRVTISGPLREPELRLTSSPPLEQSDILSLIVFNTSTNELSAAQQEELAVRAGALAFGFLANSLTAALERSIGLDILEIEPSAGVNAGARVTIGQEIAPGMLVKFSRQFGGATEYDEATFEYQLSRLLRIRATFSDASTSTTRSPFVRSERAGIDLLLFFSFE